MSDEFSETPIGALLRRRSERGQNEDELLSVTQDRGVLRQESAGRRNISSADKRSYWRVYPGDIVYNTMRMWQGASACSMHFGIVSPAYTVCEPVDGANSQYLAYLLKLPENVSKFRSRSQGIVSDVWNLRFHELKKIRIPYVASRTNQSRIAEILSTLEQAIEKTEGLITKMQQIKSGLMHDLFTRGVTPNGELRPPREEAPKFYKESPIGWIPQEWEVSRLREHAEIRTGIAKNSKLAFSNPITVKYLRVANVQDGFLDLADMKTIQIQSSDLERYRLLAGDVLMNEGGDIDKLGRGAVWKGLDEPCVHQNHVFVVRCKPSISSAFLNAWTRSTLARRYFMFAGKQTTNLASINKTQLGRLPVAVPPLVEQSSVVRSMDALEERIVSSMDEVSKLRQYKSGLMHDLLTGRVRVPDSILKKAAAAT